MSDKIELGNSILLPLMEPMTPPYRATRPGGRLAVGLAAFSLTGLLGCGGPDRTDPRASLRDVNVILITIDTLRADYVSAYGGTRAKTPHLDGLAGEGSLFERCVAQTPLTLPSHTTILSGTYPLHHRVRDNGGFMVPPELDLISEMLKRRGFRTSAFVGAYVLSSKWGTDQGFDTYSDVFDRTKYGQTSLQNERSAEEVFADAENWLAANRDSRFFIWIHLFDPHSPYNPPAPFDKYPTQPYRGEVEYIDSELGRFLSFLRDKGLYERSLLVVTGDHGEALGEHGEREHGLFLYEASVRVPLILRAPSAFPVSRVESLVEHVDITPTILDAVGMEVPAPVQGKSLLPLLFGEGGGGNAVAYTETYYPRLHYGWSELHALYDGEMKYILAPDEELYRVDIDEGETRNLAVQPGTESRMSLLKQDLTAFIGKESARALSPSTAALSRQDQQALRALGYVATTAGSSGALPDPKSKLDVFNRLDEAIADLNRGNHDQAVAAARAIVSDEPNLVEAHVVIGNALQQKRFLREALESYYRVIELKPDANFTLIDIVTVLINLGEYDRALEEARRFLETFPDDPMLLEAAGFASFYKGNLANALEYLERSNTIEPNPTASIQAADIRASQGDYERAEATIRDALAVNPSAQGAYYVLGQIAEARGNNDRALGFYDKELEHNPAAYKASFNAAILLKESGRYDAAIGYFRKTIEIRPRFNIPYFMIANYLLEQNRDLDEAIALAQQGVELAPHDESALLGCQILTAVYGRLGDRNNYDRWLRRAQEIERGLAK